MLLSFSSCYLSAGQPTRLVPPTPQEFQLHQASLIPMQAGRMPYTPSSQLSPPAQETESTSGNGDTGFHLPIEQNNHESEPSNSTQQRQPQPNHHSYTSTSYFRRHRRSPTVGKSLCLPSGSLPVSNLPQEQLKDHVVDPHASIQQSPPPVNDSLIPTGAIISPPESLCNSSDEEEDNIQRKDGKVMAELQAAIQSIDKTHHENPGSGSKKIEVSINEMKSTLSGLSKAGKKRNEINLPQRLSLPEEARKISHSRSTSELSALGPQSTSPASSPEESDQDSDEADITNRPPMVRKKSGELVRPALRPAMRKRPSSMPGTPTFSKAVHFDSHLEHIRHFLQLDKPLTVSAKSSPVEDYGTSPEFPFQESPSSELEIRLPNFPHDPEARKNSIVRLERLFLSSDKKKLVGSVAVANLAFHKHVVARFTLDYWKTTSEVLAEYNHDVRKKHAHDGYDRFYFNIELADHVNLESKVMFICIRYNTNGQEFWDNNNGCNYQVGFSKKEESKHGISGSKPQPMQPLGQPLPRSRGSLPSGSPARPKSMPPSHDDFMTGFSSSNFPEISRDTKSKKLTSGLSPPRSDDIIPETPARRSKPAAQAFGNRYDFGASLSAAMQPGGPQDRSCRTGTETLKASISVPVMTTEKKSQRETSVSSPRSGSQEAKPAALVSEKPHHQSPVYKELVDKYCFVSNLQASSLLTQLTCILVWNQAFSTALEIYVTISAIRR